MTAREQTLLALILAAAVLGAVVKHWRDARREGSPATASALASPPSAAATGTNAAKVVER